MFSKITTLAQITGLGLIVLVGFLVPQGAHALTISPAKIELSANPGQTISGKFLLINEETASMTFYTSAENFEASGETGTPNFTEGTTDLASWIHVIPTVALTKGQQKEVDFTVTVPNDAEAGGHFSAIFMGTTPPGQTGGQVSVGAKIGVLVFLRVAGDVKQGGGILSFQTASSTKLFSSLPISFSYRFQNSGGDRVQPQGPVEIKNMFGMVSDAVAANPTIGNVLPNSIRKFDVSWGDTNDIPRGFFGKASYEVRHFAFGMYTAHLALSSDQGKSTSTAAVTLFIIPWELLLLIILILVFVFYGGSKALRSYNSWIIRKARQSQIDQK